MPSSPDYKRDYKQENVTARKRGEKGPGSSDHKRKTARRRFEAKKGMLKGKDVDHIKPLSKGGSNDMSNLRAVSPKKNRSFKRTSTGAIA